jgi:pseudaminic acid synthase
VKIVAEIGAAHNGTLERAIRTIQAAADVGADAIKLQTWTPDTMDCGGRIVDSGTWRGMALRDLYRKAHTPWEWYPALIMEATRLGLEWWSTPFDAPSVWFLEVLGCPRYKIASFEIVDLDLIGVVSTTGKPIIISTGMATQEEIGSAVSAAHSSHVTLLKCVSGYPADPADYNLNTMHNMRLKFNRPVGLSDHTLTPTLAVCATVLGASMIERHLTLSKEDGLDDSFASTPDEFQDMVKCVKTAQEALGTVRYGVMPSELPQHALRRSLWVWQDVRAGDPITHENVRTARPADGLPPAALSQLLGKVFVRDIPGGTPMSLDMSLDLCR